ncbi:GNAT family N-acetyltransferase [Candidatus Bathyarchaeota archaeon]|nr:GNAT family N-acetyltransferase [Candidatus Bathyarchaeota archaeon]MBS7631054.1 GNAT family N-acetyltransferase [Candidatus Bathyarchaeota archaeon]
MLSYLKYSLKSVQKIAEEKLTESFGRPLYIKIKNHVDEATLSAIRKIESSAFREELRYTKEEILDKSLNDGFILILVYDLNKPVAFLFGYSEPSNPSTFYLDTVATLIEGKGLGSCLINLILLHCYESGYAFITLRTEEEDEKGRRLRRFYEKFGFRVYPCDPREGIAMINEIDKLNIILLLDKILPSEKKNRNEVFVQSSFYSPIYRVVAK